MASFSNTRLLDKPPLFNSGYRVGGSEINKPVNFNSLAPAPPVHHLKILKVESDIPLVAETDVPTFKRPRIIEENQQLQLHSWQARDGAVINDRQSARLEHNVSQVDVQDEGKPSPTTRKSTILENHFNEPSPLLGLNLRKSPSLLDLIQRKLAHNEEDGSDGLDKHGRLSRFGNSASAVDKDKLKAANFPASKLRIGTWECTSRHEGDLVAKCYYAKRKLVWEVLDRDLKSKMEVQWSDISALKAVFPDDQPAVLDIELSRPPLFFREINPQPRKHTLWQSTSDFTHGQATICRHHSLQFPVGVLNRHFEKLLQCDARLKALNEQFRNIIDSCFFDNRSMQSDQQHMLHYQSVLGDHSVLQSFRTSGMKDEALLQSTAFRTLDCTNSQVAVQGLHTQPYQHGSPHHTSVENKIAVPLLQCTVNDASALGGFCHRKGAAYHLQLSKIASPSSVIDHRGLNESSSSSETEEAAMKEARNSEICRPFAHLHGPEDNYQLMSTVSSVSSFRQLAEWAPPRRSKEHASPWALDRTVTSAHNYSLEQQALNDLSLHLLGEPISSTDPHGYSSAGRLNGHDAAQVFGDSGASHLQPLSHKENPPAHKPDTANPQHHDYVSFGESSIYTKVPESSLWNPVWELHSLETVPSSLAAAYGSHVDSLHFASCGFPTPPFVKPGL